MSRNGSGVFSLPAQYLVASGDTVLPAQHNTPLEDIETDLNTARPIVAGGTGATTAADALDNLGVGPAATPSFAGLGVGVSSPNETLEVRDGNSTQLRLTSTSASAAGGIDFYGNTSEYAAFVNAAQARKALELSADPNNLTANSSIDLYVDGTEIARVNSTGLGVGVTSPNEKLEVRGSGGTQVRVTSTGAAGAGGIDFYGNTTEYAAYVNAVQASKSLDLAADPSDLTPGSAVIVSVDGSNVAWFDENARFGLGVSSPNAKAEFRAASSKQLRLTATGATQAGGVDFYGNTTEYAGSVNGYQPRKSMQIIADPDNLTANSAVEFQVDGGEVSRINTTGLGYGTTSPQEAGHFVGTGGTTLRLDSSGATASGGIDFYGNTSSIHTATINSVFASGSISYEADPGNTIAGSQHTWKVDNATAATLDGDGLTVNGGRVDLNTGTGAYIKDGGAQLYLGANGADYVRVWTDGAFTPEIDDEQSLGLITKRWSEIFAGNGVIKTSDAREKLLLDDGTIPDAVLDAWADVQYCAFKWHSAIEKKGDAARKHTGLIAQNVRDCFEAHGLDPFELGVLCYDEWDAETDEDGNVTTEAGNRYGLRYSEAQAIEAAYQRRRMEAIEQRLEALEAA